MTGYCHRYISISLQELKKAVSHRQFWQTKVQQVIYSQKQLNKNNDNKKKHGETLIAVPVGCQRAKPYKNTLKCKQTKYT